MIHKKYNLFFFWILLFVLTLTSCGSKKQRVALPADFKGPKELSRLYGVRLTPDDNIFLYNEGAKWLGVPHRMGGLTKKGVDCSGFVAIVFREVYGKAVSTFVGRYAEAQLQESQSCQPEGRRSGLFSDRQGKEESAQSCWYLSEKRKVYSYQHFEWRDCQQPE